jgi:hypothetical protein
VVLSYPGGSFLVNREEILSSHYGRQGANAGAGPPVGAMGFRGNTIPLVNLDEHMRCHFGETTEGPPGIVLFIRGNGDRPPFPRTRRRSDGEAVDTSVVAMRTSARATMESIRLSELRPFPSNVRHNLASLGLLAVRFPPESKRPQYLLDLRIAAILTVIRYHNTQARNEHSHR